MPHTTFPSDSPPDYSRRPSIIESPYADGLSEAQRTEALRLLGNGDFPAEKLDRDRNAAILWAAQVGEPLVVAYCLERWEERAPRRKFGVSLPKATRRLSKVEPGLAFTQNEHKADPIHLAAQNGNADIVKILLAYGVPVDLDHEIWGTPLHLASQSGSVETVQLLLDAGADINRLTLTKHQSPLQIAAETSQHPVVQLLLERGALPNHGRNHRALHSAAEMGAFNVVQLLLDHGAEIDALNNSERTALHLAARDGYGAVAALLVSVGANLDLRDDTRRMSALDHACRNGHADVVQLLLSAGAEAKLSRDALGFTPLHAAAQNGHLLIVKILLSHGVDPGLRNRKGRTAVQLAMEEGHTEVARFLMSVAEMGGSAEAGPSSARGLGDELPAYGDWSRSASLAGEHRELTREEADWKDRTMSVY